MPIVEMDAIFVRIAQCQPGKRKTDYYSKHDPGLILEARATGGLTWYQRYHCPNGRLKAMKLGSPPEITLSKARKLAEKVRARAAVGEDPLEAKREQRRTLRYGEYAPRYLTHTATYQRSPDTTEQYMRKHILPRWSKVLMSDIRQEDVAQWLGDMAKQGYAPATIERARVVFSHSLKLAMRWGEPGLTTNPCVGIPRPPLNNARDRYLTSEEAARLRDAVEKSRNKQLKYIVGLLIHSACRVSEILHAEWGHVDFDRRLLRVPQSKTGKARFVALSQGALDLIAALPRYDDCPYLVPNPKTKKPWVSFFMSWDTARKQAGLGDFRVHDIRHSAASYMAAAGVSLLTISRALGHQSYKTTQRYAHLANDELISAVDAGAAKMGVDWTPKDK